jgi:hypothetical protein
MVRPLRRRLAFFLLCLGISSLALFPAAAGARESGVRSESAAPPAGVAGPPWCDKTIWRGRAMPKNRLQRRIRKVLSVARTVDDVTTIVSLVLAIGSAGQGAVPGAVAKLLSKLGKEAIERSLKNVGRQIRRFPRHRYVGIQLKLRCKWGVPYPSLGGYAVR